jgi:PAP_fibrillin
MAGSAGRQQQAMHTAGCVTVQGEEAATCRPPVPQAGKLSGEWKLVYTAGSELSALLALSRLPFVTVGDITQTIDCAAGTVVNKVGGTASRPAPRRAHF